MSRQIISTTRADGTRSTYTLQPGSAVPMQLEALKPLKPSKIKADRRTYPKYKPGMSTAEYVAAYEAGNNSGMHCADFWQSLNTAPAAGYVGIDTVEHGDFDLITDDAPASPEVAELAPVAPSEPEPVAAAVPAELAPAAAPVDPVPAVPAILQAWQVVAAAANGQPGAETLAEAEALALACLARYGQSHPAACAHLASFSDWHRAALAEIRAAAAPEPAAAGAPAADPAPWRGPDNAAARARVYAVHVRTARTADAIAPAWHADGARLRRSVNVPGFDAASRQLRAAVAAALRAERAAAAADPVPADPAPADLVAEALAELVAVGWTAGPYARAVCQLFDGVGPLGTMVTPNGTRRVIVSADDCGQLRAMLGDAVICKRAALTDRDHARRAARTIDEDVSDWVATKRRASGYTAPAQTAAACQEPPAAVADPVMVAELVAGHEASEAGAASLDRLATADSEYAARQPWDTWGRSAYAAQRAADCRAAAAQIRAALATPTPAADPAPADAAALACNLGSLRAMHAELSAELLRLQRSKERGAGAMARRLRERLENVDAAASMTARRLSEAAPTPSAAAPAAAAAPVHPRMVDALAILAAAVAPREDVGALAELEPAGPGPADTAAALADPVPVPVPAVAPADDGGFRARVEKAAAWIGTGRPTSRAFDSCFEMWDGAAVCVALLERAQRRPDTKLAANLWRYLARHHVEKVASERPRGLSLAEWSRQLVARSAPAELPPEPAPPAAPAAAAAPVHPRMAEALAILAAAVQPVDPDAAADAAACADDALARVYGDAVADAMAAAPPAGPVRTARDGVDDRAARLAAPVVGIIGTDPARLAPALRRESARVAAAAESVPGRIAEGYRRTARALADMATAEHARTAPDRDTLAPDAPRPDPAALVAELDQITAAARDRMGGRTGSELSAMTPAELARRHAILQQLPTFAEERQAARQRIAARLAARQARPAPARAAPPADGWRTIAARPAPAGAFAGFAVQAPGAPCSDIGAAAMLPAAAPAGWRWRPDAPVWRGRRPAGAFPALIGALGGTRCSDIGAAAAARPGAPGAGALIRRGWPACTMSTRPAGLAARVRRPGADPGPPRVATSAHQYGAGPAPPARSRHHCTLTPPPSVATSAHLRRHT